MDHETENRIEDIASEFAPSIIRRTFPGIETDEEAFMDLSLELQGAIYDKLLDMIRERQPG
jgi:hypothetical protein